MTLRDRITIDLDKRADKPCICGMRITVSDVLSYLASGMSYEEILEDFPYLEKEDILACLAYGADPERFSVVDRSSLKDVIESTPEILRGKPRLKGTRIPVSLVLGYLAEGYTAEQLIVEYPDLTKMQIAACLAYARDLSVSDISPV